MESTVDGREFVSPAHARFGVAVELDVLLLTNLTIRSGDVDNRLKTLIDGLTRPANRQQLQNHVEPPEGGPTFCLLDDDHLVQRVSLDSRPWHEPNLAQNEALVVVTAKLVLDAQAGMDTPVSTLFFLVS